MEGGDAAIRIQSAWRSHRGRALVRRFSDLPRDLWCHILGFVRRPSSVFLGVDRLLRNKTAALCDPFSAQDLPAQLRVLCLIRRNMPWLSDTTVYKAWVLSLRMLRLPGEQERVSRMLINATLEALALRITS